MFDNNKKTTDYKKARDEHNKASSRERLKKIGQQKIKTTMIGAIATIEDKLGYLWENDPRMRDVFDSIRCEILDKGNNQMRNFEVELTNYEVVWNKYHMVLPMKRKDQ